MTAPTVGNVVTSGTFTETLHLQMTILVVRAADLQAAAATQLTAALAKAKTGLSLVPQQPIQLTQFKNTSSANGSEVDLSFTAVGQVASQISEETVRTLVYGKSVADALQTLVGKDGIPTATRPNHGQSQLLPLGTVLDAAHQRPFQCRSANDASDSQH